MTIQTRTVEYTHNYTLLEAYMAWDDVNAGPRPGVLVCHAFRGREDFECERAEELAAMGYVGFALDLYGKDVVATEKEEAFALMAPFQEDRNLLQSRLLACVEAAVAQAEIDTGALAAIGYCFGGMCALDLARINAPLRGVASFHGLLKAAPDVSVGRPSVGRPSEEAMAAKVLVLHGWDDPMVPPEQVLEFTEEMTAAGADWQLHGYGGTVHAFTNPAANDPDFGAVYNPAAQRRSWQSLSDFLAEIF